MTEPRSSRSGQPRPLYVCEVCGRLAPITSFNDACRPGWTHGRLTRVESAQLTSEDAAALAAGKVWKKPEQTVSA